MPSNLIIEVDFRERSSKIAEILTMRGCNVSETHLRVGDFKLGNLVIERKTVRDFQISIIDGRLFRQIQSIRKNFERGLLIIENDAHEREDFIHINAAQGALLKITTLWQLPYIYAQSAHHSAEIIKHIYDQECAGRNSHEHKVRWGYKLRGQSMRSQNRIRQLLLEGIRGVGPRRAHALLNHFGSLRNIFNASPRELSEVKGIPGPLAEFIGLLSIADSRIEGGRGSLATTGTPVMETEVKSAR